jgi:hypothetical protein
MDHAMNHFPSQRNCENALRQAKDQQLFPLEKWKEWNKLIKERFKDDQQEKAEERRKIELTIKETVEMMRSSRTEDKEWKRWVRNWTEIPERKQQRRRNQYEEMRWKYGRPRIRKPEKLEVEVLTNNPSKSMSGQSSQSRFKWDTRSKWGPDWKDDELESVAILNERGRMRTEEGQRWIDGSRYMLNAQPRNGEVNSEQCTRIAEPKAPGQRLFKETEWRKELSRIWQEDDPGWE